MPGPCWHDCSQVTFMVMDVREKGSLKPDIEILNLFAGAHIFPLFLKAQRRPHEKLNNRRMFMENTAV